MKITKFKFKASFLSLILVLPVFFGCEGESSSEGKDSPVIRLTVEALGGCTSAGYCGIKLSDGSFGIADIPVVGQKVCRGGKYGDLDLRQNRKYWTICDHE